MNGKARMTTESFCSYLHSLEAQNRQIILSVDNCAAHPKDTSFLRNVKVVRYLANKSRKVIFSIEAKFREAAKDNV